MYRVTILYMLLTCNTHYRHFVNFFVQDENVRGLGELTFFIIITNYSGYTFLPLQFNSGYIYCAQSLVHN